MGSSKFYGIDEGSDVYRPEYDTVVKDTTPEPDCEPIDEEINKAVKEAKILDPDMKAARDDLRRVMSKTITEAKEDGVSLSDFAKSDDNNYTDNSVSSSLDVLGGLLKGLLKLMCFLLPLIIIGFLFITMGGEIIDAVNSANSSNELAELTDGQFAIFDAIGWFGPTTFFFITVVTVVFLWKFIITPSYRGGAV